jgi:uracil phosphoribosyltransferase
LGYSYDVETVNPSQISIVPILRSGLGMVEGLCVNLRKLTVLIALAIQTLLPDPVPVHHLGLFREPVSLQPVEYYNNLPYHSTPPSSGSQHLAIILDPIIATGGTAAAAIQSLREWGVSKVVVISILGSEEGLKKALEEWENVEIWVGGVDGKLNQKGMIVPGVGDVGDRLFGTKGK